MSVSGFVLNQTQRREEGVNVPFRRGPTTEDDGARRQPEPNAQKSEFPPGPLVVENERPSHHQQRISVGDARVDCVLTDVVGPSPALANSKVGRRAPKVESPLRRKKHVLPVVRSSEHRLNNIKKTF